MNRQLTALVLFALVAALGARGAAQTVPAASTTPDADALDAIIREATAAFDVPGLAIAVVKDGVPVLERGYGVRRAGDSAAVDAHTLFYTASATKAFTVTGLGVLADEGQIRLDSPLSSQLPGFALADEDLTESLTLRDALAHRTGVPRADLFLVGGFTSADVLPRLSALAPVAPLRTRFTYSNQMYLAAGLLLEHAAGSSWQSFIESRVLAPIGFVDGNAAGVGHIATGRDAASPHVRPGGAGTAAVAFTNVPRQGYGAGGVNASAADMSRWLLFNLGNGTVDGQRVVSPNVLGAIQTPQTLVAPQPTMPGAVMAAYGLGWFVHDYRGRKIVQHGGNGEGWTTLVWMSPSDRLGIAVLTNVHNSTAPWAIALSIADRYLGHPPTDWNASFAAAEARLGPPALRAPAAPLTEVTSADAGSYMHPLYGTAQLVAADGTLRFTYGDLTGIVDGTALSWTRPDMIAIVGPGRLSIRDNDGRRTITMEAGGERFEFTRHQ